jgi:hypothetical protein
VCEAVCEAASSYGCRQPLPHTTVSTQTVCMLVSLGNNRSQQRSCCKSKLTSAVCPPEVSQLLRLTVFQRRWNRPGALLLPGALAAALLRPPVRFAVKAHLTFVAVSGESPQLTMS